MTYLFNNTAKQALSLIDTGQATPDELFYDWFCSDKSLNRRALNLIPKVKTITKLLELDTSKYKLTFKNNCPVHGDLYDSFTLDELNEKVRIWFSPKLGYDCCKNKCEITIFNKNYDTVYEKSFDNWSDFKKQLKSNLEMQNEIKQALK